MHLQLRAYRTSHLHSVFQRQGGSPPPWAMARCLCSCKRGRDTCWEPLLHTKEFKGPIMKTAQSCKRMTQTTSEIISLLVCRAGGFRAVLVPITARTQLPNSNGTHILGRALLPLFLYHRTDTQYMQLIWQIYRFKSNLASSVHIVGKFSNLSIHVDLKASLASFVNAVTCPSHAWCLVIKLFLQ